MPTSFLDQFWILDPFSPPPVGTLLTVSNLLITDQNNNGLVNRFSNDSIDGSDIRQSYPGDTVTVNLPGGGTATITGVTFYLADGRVVFTPTDGATLQDATLVSTTFVTGQASVSTTAFAETPICFAPGTNILTVSGERPVETLQAGDLLVTADRGAVPLVWRHQHELPLEHLAAQPKHAPIRIPAGALGPGLPTRDLTVSPQHRMVIRSAIAERMFDAAEIMVPACQLVGWNGIERVTPQEEVIYIHLLVDHHAVLFAESAPAESLFLGPQVQEGLTPRECDLLRARIPGLEGRMMDPAREFVRGPRLRRLLERHEKNGKPLVEENLGSEERLIA